MNNLEEQVRDVKGIIEKYWETHEGCEPAEPSREITACIDSLVSEYGYRNVADAFGIKTKQFYLNFDEYTTDAESFESDEDGFPDEDCELFVYKAYCRWRPYWPVLISSSSMNSIKDHQSHVRHCHGEFFKLTKKKLNLAVAVLNQLWEWEKDGFSWTDEDCLHLIETHEFIMTDADFEQMHAKFQGSRIKSIVLELINSSHELSLDAIKAYTLCLTRSVTPDGWGSDIYVLSESDRAEIIRALAAKAGAEVGKILFDHADIYHPFYLWGTDERLCAFGIFIDEEDSVVKPSYRPNVDIVKYLLPEFALKQNVYEISLFDERYEDLIASFLMSKREYLSPALKDGLSYIGNDNYDYELVIVDNVGLLDGLTIQCAVHKLLSGEWRYKYSFDANSFDYIRVKNVWKIMYVENVYQLKNAICWAEGCFKLKDADVDKVELINNIKYPAYYVQEIYDKYDCNMSDLALLKLQFGVILLNMPECDRLYVILPLGRGYTIDDCRSNKLIEFFIGLGFDSLANTVALALMVYERKE